MCPKVHAKTCVVCSRKGMLPAVEHYYIVLLRCQPCELLDNDFSQFLLLLPPALSHSPPFSLPLSVLIRTVEAVAWLDKARLYDRRFILLRAYCFDVVFCLFVWPVLSLRINFMIIIMIGLHTIVTTNLSTPTVHHKCQLTNKICFFLLFTISTFVCVAHTQSISET